MFDFAGTSPFLIIAKQVAMAIMHFRITQTGLFFRIMFFALREVPGSNLTHMRNCTGGIQARSH